MLEWGPACPWPMRHRVDLHILESDPFSMAATLARWGAPVRRWDRPDAPTTLGHVALLRAEGDLPRRHSSGAGWGSGPMASVRWDGSQWLALEELARLRSFGALLDSAGCRVWDVPLVDLRVTHGRELALWLRAALVDVLEIWPYIGKGALSLEGLEVRPAFFTGLRPPDRPGRARRSTSYRRHWLYVLERDGAVCVYCQRTESLTLDHIHPVALGGSDDPTNLQVACRYCNSKKGVRSHEEMLREMGLAA